MRWVCADLEGVWGDVALEHVMRVATHDAHIVDLIEHLLGHHHVICSFAKVKFCVRTVCKKAS